MTDWKNKLLPASFRNVPFKVQGHSSSGGRKGVHHQYTGKDEETPEDLGLKGRRFSVNAYVLGKDYMDKRDALIDALEEEGVGPLVLNTVGPFDVSIDFEAGFSVSETTDEGGMARFQLNFVKGALEEKPAVRKNTGQAVTQSAANVRMSAAEQFKESFSVSSAPEFIRSAADTDIKNLIAKFEESKAQLWTATANELDGGLLQLTESFPTLGVTAGKVAQSVETVFSVATLPEQAVGVFNNIASTSLVEDVPNSVGELATDWRKQQLSNSTAFNQLVSSNAIASMAEAASTATFSSYEEAISTMTATVAHIDAEIATTTSIDSYDALENLRAEFVTHIQGTSANLAREVVIPNNISKPTVLLSYQLYEDLDRAEEIAIRNGINHPNKVAAGLKLEVLNV